MQLLKLMIIIMLGAFYCPTSFADYSEPTKRVSNNTKTDLFEQSIDDWRGFESGIDSDRAGIANKLNSGAKSTLEFVTQQNKDEIKSNADSLNAIKANALSDTADQKLREDSYNYLEELYPDYTSPTYVQHKADAETIAAASGELLGALLSKLQDLGVDCSARKSDKEIEPEYYIDTKFEKSPKDDTIYNNTICEELHNKYTCKDALSLHCNHVISKPSTIHITGANLPVLENRVGYALFGSHNSDWLDGGVGTLYDYYVTFNVVHPENIASFKIGSINYDDWVLVKLNGHYIWSGPRGGAKLDFIGPKQSLGWRRVIIDDSGQTYSSENKTWFHQYLNLEMQRYLQQGTNTLSFRLIVGDKGGLLFDLSTEDRECNSWIETWNEKCTLN